MSTPVYSTMQERTSISDLFRDLFHTFSNLINTQVELTKTEIKASTQKLATAIALGVVGLLLGFLFLGFLGVSLILLLTPAFGLAWASVVTTVAYLVITGLAFFLALREIRKNTAEIDIELNKHPR